MKSLPSAPAPSHASLTKAMDPSKLPLVDLCATQQQYLSGERRVMLISFQHATRTNVDGEQS